MSIVDIEIKQIPSVKKVASLERTGAEGSNPLRKEFQELEKWAKKSKVKTGKYLFHFNQLGKDRYRLEACLEVRGSPKPQGKIKIKSLPKLTVARVRFNPDKVSPRLVYNGIYGWLDGNKEYKLSSRYSREIYSDNPWRSSWAWARAEIQVPVTKKK